jgi:hypothetical protein
MEAMRRGIIACEARLHGSNARRCVYHDAITAFYLEKILAFAISAPPCLGLLELANDLLTSELANPRLHFGLIHTEVRPSEVITPVPSELEFHDCQSVSLSASVTAGEPMDLLCAV